MTLKSGKYIEFSFLKTFLVISIALVSIGTVENTFAAKFKDVPLPAVETGKGRVFIYRTKSVFGAAMRSPIYVNAKMIGKSKRGTIGYLDLAPGMYDITTEGQAFSDNEGGVNFALLSGQTLYVKTWIGGSGFINRTNVSIIDPKEANVDIPKLKFIEYGFEEGDSSGQ
jgi:hypothetical protein